MVVHGTESLSSKWYWVQVLTCTDPRPSPCRHLGKWASRWKLSLSLSMPITTHRNKSLIIVLGEAGHSWCLPMVDGTALLYSHNLWQQMMWSGSETKHNSPSKDSPLNKPLSWTESNTTAVAYFYKRYRHLSLCVRELARPRMLWQKTFMPGLTESHLNAESQAK